MQRNYEEPVLCIYKMDEKDVVTSSYIDELDENKDHLLKWSWGETW